LQIAIIYAATAAASHCDARVFSRSTLGV